MTDIELLPLPNSGSGFYEDNVWHDTFSKRQMEACASANMAPLIAEIERLRAVRDSFQRVGIAAQARTEQLAEALRDGKQIVDEFLQCANVGRPQGKLLAQAKDWLADADEALGRQPEDPITAYYTDRNRAGWVEPRHATAADVPPSTPVGVEGIDASDNADYIEHCAGVLREHGYRVTASALADIATEHRALAQQPAAVDGPCRLVDDVVTVNGMALDEVVRLGDRYAATIEKQGMPRAAQVFEALVLIGKHALAAQPGGSDNDRWR